MDCMGTSASDKILLERIEDDFTYNAPTGDKAERHDWIRNAGKSMAKQIAQTCPPGREQEQAIACIEQAVMWAHAAIARH